MNVIWAMHEDLKAATDRIEELEAKLAKATGVLEQIVRGDDDADNWAIHRFACRWTLAELKGGKGC